MYLASVWASLEEIIDVIDECNYISGKVYNHYLISDDLKDLRKILKTKNNITPLEFIKQFEEKGEMVSNMDDIRTLMLIYQIVNNIIRLVDDDVEFIKYIRIASNVNGNEDILL